MSWDVDLHCDACGHAIRSWNYTHNCNGMIEAVLDADEVDQTGQAWWSKLGNTAMGRGSWWRLLDGRTGAQGKALLERIIAGLEADPARFEAMNPPNGWGSYERLLEVLREMRDAVPEGPTRWEASG